MVDPGRWSPSSDGTAAATAAVDRRRGQAPIGQIAERFRTAFANSPVGFALLTPDGSFVYANAALCSFLDCQPSEMAGLGLIERVVPEDGDLAAAAIESLLDDVEPARFSARFDVAGARQWADLTLHLVRDRSGRPLLVTVHVEDRTQHIEVLGRLGHADRVTLVSQMAVAVGHDVRNALAVLQAHVELLEDDLSEPRDLDELRRQVGSMRSAIDRAYRLSGRMVDLVRPTAPDRELVDLVGLVTSIAPLLEAVAPAESHVEVVSEGAALVAADPAELERVLLTVMANAFDATDGGGTVRVEVSVVPGADARSGPGQVRLRVSDSGTGMDVSTLERAFEPFFTTKRSGVGLGLAASRSLVEALGGSIQISSTPGSGTTVDVMFPAVDHES